MCPTREQYFESWESEDLDEKLTQLLLLDRPHPKCQEPLVRESWHHGMVQEQGHLIKVQDLFGPDISTQKKPHTIILHGAARIGKSTLARQVREAWKQGRLYQGHFQYVFHLNCRELALSKVLSLAELIIKGQDVVLPPIGQILSQSEQLLLILDGLDEPKWVFEEETPELCLHWSQKQPVHTLLGSLLSKTTLPDASLLITARTTALGKLMPSLRMPRCVEVLGFSKTARKDFFFKYFLDESQAAKAFSSVKSNHALLTMCLMPWVSQLVCICLKLQMEHGKGLMLTPQTTTALCLHYLSQIFPTRPEKTQLRALCSLAAEGIWKGKTQFSSKDLRKYGLEEAIISTLLNTGVLHIDSSCHSYCFSHLCFQDFLATIFCILQEADGFGNIDIIKGVKSSLGICGRNDLFGALTSHFLFGLLSEHGARKLENIFNCQMSQEAKEELLQWVEAEVQNENPYSAQSYSLDLLHCLYEIQDKVFLTLAMAHFQGAMMCVLTDIEFHVFVFCLKFCYNVSRLRVTVQEKTQHEEELEPSSVVLLVSCGLTSRCCQVLASVLSDTPTLMELDLQQNDVGSRGVILLCKGLKHPRCQLKLLWVDHNHLNEAVSVELRDLEKVKPQLLVSSISESDHAAPTSQPPCQNGVASKLIRRLSFTFLSTSLGTKENLELTTILPFPEESSPQVAQVEPFCLSSSALLEDPPTELLGTDDNFWGPTGLVATRVIDKDKNLYRVHFPVAGSYHWPNTGLRFTVRGAVTIEIEFCTWSKFLDQSVSQHNWMVAGPLFDIKAEPGAVAAVHLPHFVDLQGDHVDISMFQVAHFKDEGMLLEKPTRVEPSSTVLKEPSFSPMGVLLRMLPATALRFIPITSTVLLYHHPDPKEVTFHLYLIPSDCSIQKAIDDEEKKFQFVRLHKPPPVAPLYMGSRYIVSSSKNLEIIPKELELCYQNPGESQLFSEFYIDHLGSGIRLEMKDKKEGIVVWKALVKQASASLATVPDTLHFVDRYREQLVACVTLVDPVLDKLHGHMLSEEQYESVRAETTKPDQMWKLFSFSRSWDWACKNRFYQALREAHPYLIVELWEKWGSMGNQEAS
ncbi:NACHT, LRR and PYD domains-containing protein 1-like [Rhynchocyon petersi]